MAAQERLPDPLDASRRFAVNQFAIAERKRRHAKSAAAARWRHLRSPAHARAGTVVGQCHLFGTDQAGQQPA
jgi:hypothetical protein